MQARATIVVADRNPHVRDFLRREMTSEGYSVKLARNAKELLDIVFAQENIDMAIVDPDLPDEEAAVLLRKLEDRLPPLPVMIHSFASEEHAYTYPVNIVGFVEKRGNSIEKLKRVIMNYLVSIRK
ncbi:MAG: hypothetical protein COZ70_08830 [Deltaproteobacteria bacterium CG_4_8_14_3_um_filter_51_11]|nr:response regulator [bacterium]OIP40854.1 MAG: hypothetical protein AUK25_07095 [Desulfobacteraceae bacterium CG2_30_51_40]PIP47440.1 MAG: hypothetical protein COX16_04205 [Deltaproteobacteria bacterium CG23_combo_of_CG06-09_8_20_14_all_51_20]PIX19459.1 MAG: hypothetical protein COZ70_08830 [Deltaproteobacteria bacterium CG_4_8_14_3_um_filter_51_11]PJB35178.1 MAG: hypothetical protein CO107_11335 [Deltaproteobacteria bacterium CG_4_9_14_3_um_filter_51_14]